MKTKLLLSTSLLAASLLAVAPAVAQTFAQPVENGISIPGPDGGWVRYTPKPRSNVIGSSTYEGVTRTLTRNEDGTHTLSVTDENGNTHAQARGPMGPGIFVPDDKGRWKKWTPKPKSKVIGSSTYDGKTITVTDNGNGTRTVTTVDENGNTHTEVRGPMAPGIYVPDDKGGWKKWTPKPKSKVIGSSTYDGKTITVTDNGNGTRTVTTVDENGNTTSEVRR